MNMLAKSNLEHCAMPIDGRVSSLHLFLTCLFPSYNSYFVVPRGALQPSMGEIL